MERKKSGMDVRRRALHGLGLGLGLALSVGHFVAPSAARQTVTQQVAFLPFEDMSNFSGLWEISRLVPSYLGQRLAENPYYVVMPADSVELALEGDLWPTKDPEELAELGRKMGADIVMLGTIKEFNTSRLGLSAPFGAGFTSLSQPGGDKIRGQRLAVPVIGRAASYSGKAAVKLHLVRTLDGELLDAWESEGNAKDRDLVSVDVLARRDQKDMAFYGLDEIEFGSDEFHETVIGLAVSELADEVRVMIENTVPPPPPVRKAIVLRVAGDEAYVNVGSASRVAIGDKFAVYSEVVELTDPVSGEVIGESDELLLGIVQVVEIKSPQLSKAKIIEGEGQIKAHDLVRAE